MGGLEKAMLNLSHLFLLENIDVTIVTLYRFKHFYKVDPRIRIIEPPDYRFDYSKPVYYIRFVAFFRSLILDRFNFDVILSFHEYCNYQIVLSGLFQPIPIVVSDRGSPGLRLTFPSNLLRRLLYPFSAGIIYQTDTAKNYFKSKRGWTVKSVIIPNALDNAILNKEVIPIESRKNQICWFGRLHWEKGLNYLLQAFKLFISDASNKELNSQWNLKIIGSGPDEGKLIDLAEKLGINDKIFWMPAVKDVFEEIRDSKIFVLTSLREGYPNSLIEAMSMGIVPISFNCLAGPNEIINDGINGFLVKVGDSETVAERLDYLVNNDLVLKQISEEAMQVRNTNNPRSIARKYLDFLESLV